MHADRYRTRLLSCTLASCAAAAALQIVSCSTSSSSGGAPSSGGVDASASDGGASDSAAPNYDFTPLHDVLFGGKWATEGVVVLVDGQRVYEEYAAGFDASKRHILYSASKTIGAALVGIAASDGLLKLSDSVCTYVQAPSGADPSLCDTSIEHLLHMESGLKWAEDYGSDPTTSDVLQMLYGGVSDMGLYVAGRPRANPAGAVWQYSSGDSDLLALALKNALKGQDVRGWMKAKLFDPAGLSSVLCETDRAGTPVFSSSCFATVRDMAAFGQLYLDDGMSGSKRVLPANWVAYSIAPVSVTTQPQHRDADAGPGNTGGSYGAQVWLNAASPNAPSDSWMYGTGTVDTYSFEGHYGQLVFVIPSKKLVIARTGNDRDPEFDREPMLAAALAVIAKGGK